MTENLIKTLTAIIEALVEQRKSKLLTIENLSDFTKRTHKQLEQLESCQFEELPQNFSYLKGIISSYIDFLELPQVEKDKLLQELYDAYHNEKVFEPGVLKPDIRSIGGLKATDNVSIDAEKKTEKTDVKDTDSTAEKSEVVAKTSNRKYLKLVLVVFVFVLLFVFAFRSFNAGTDALIDDKLENTQSFDHSEEAVAVPNEMDTNTEQNTDGMAATETNTEPSSNSNSESDDLTASESNVRHQAAEVSVPPLDPNNAPINIYFNQDQTILLKDADGNELISGSYFKGRTVITKGKLPFNITLDDANAVAVQINGRQINVISLRKAPNNQITLKVN